LPSRRNRKNNGDLLMCGIVGYIGTKEAVPVILDGLRRLEYRGYDSAGIAVAGNGEGLQIRRAAGKLCNLEEVVRQNPLDGTYGIGHTRWATHGCPTEQNAHPHRDCSGKLVVVHNGIIENYLQLQQWLRDHDHKLVTQTDSEVIAHLIEHYYFGGTSTPSRATPARAGGPGTDEITLEEAVRMAIPQLAGAFAFSVILESERDKIVVARCGPPAVIGVGSNEYFVASDIPAILAHTREVLFLDDGEMAIVTPAGVQLTDFSARPLTRAPQHINWDSGMAEKNGFPHFMLKEIYEQPRATRDTTLGRVAEDRGEILLDEVQITPAAFRAMNRLNIAACGTSWHAGMTGKVMIERLARVPVELDYASEYRYRDLISRPDEITLLISQSGETADTLAALREAKRRGQGTLTICNVVGSMMTREADGTIYTHAGPEIGAASTKTFTTQLAALFILAMHLGRVRGTLSAREARALIAELNQLPEKMEAALALSQQCQKMAASLAEAVGFLFLGRGVHFPIALEGALKLKEISYVHAQGYPAGEMKHGPNALIDESLPVVVLATCDPGDPRSVVRYEKTRSNIKEVTSRSGRVIAVATAGDEEIRQEVEHVLYVPPAHDLLAPLLEIIPLQLLAYHIATARGCEVDQPRNLAKSVTVE
jgi:glucosamine--fructose-6-phosphate aminotransferase (isomerizing)